MRLRSMTNSTSYQANRSGNHRPITAAKIGKVRCSVGVCIAPRGAHTKLAVFHRAENELLE